MTALLLAEELFLLTHDDESGKPSATMALDNGLAGALLLDLVETGAARAEGKSLVPTAAEPSHPLLIAAQRVLRGSEKPRTAAHWVQHLPQSLKPMATTVGESLAVRGVLTERHRKVLGIFPTTEWPEVDPTPERELRQRLRRVLVDGEDADGRTGLLIALLQPLSLVRGVVGRGSARQAEARAKEIVKTTVDAAVTSSAVADSVRSVQAAIISAAVVPSVVAATSFS